MIDWTPFWLSLKLAALTTALLLFIAAPLAWWLSQHHSPFKPLIESVLALPIVLPPSVLGFYFLLLFAPQSPLGSFLLACCDLELLFTFPGLVVASTIYSLPFMVQPLQSGFQSLPREIIEASYLAGKGFWTTFLRIALPSIKPALMSGIIVTFAHTMGEFGVVLMVGGSIPGETKVASVAIYEFVEQLRYEEAHIYSALMLAISFLALLLLHWSTRRRG
ncbi:MAG: molybdate ABC transporter permease subunit [Nitratiruptor sp.]|nr:molybdate ABC transporter permease subunit [Nitratiruptor sp.]NPA82887.1 molybdate ABC transporter permease subunit [Campylobacterota bacterium]